MEPQISQKILMVFWIHTNNYTNYKLYLKAMLYAGWQAHRRLLIYDKNFRLLTGTQEMRRMHKSLFFAVAVVVVVESESVVGGLAMSVKL